LGDESLKCKANVHIAYYWIFKKDFVKARHLLDKTLRKTKEHQDAQVWFLKTSQFLATTNCAQIQKMVEAALVRCEKEHRFHDSQITSAA
jgi:hypothetical protein